jgi:hypothetical protein
MSELYKPTFDHLNEALTTSVEPTNDSPDNLALAAEAADPVLANSANTSLSQLDTIEQPELTTSTSTELEDNQANRHYQPKTMNHLTRFIRNNALKLGVLSTAVMGVGALSPELANASQGVRDYRVTNHFLMTMKNNLFHYIDNNVFIDSLQGNAFPGMTFYGSITAEPHTFAYGASCQVFRYGNNFVGNNIGYDRFNRQKNFIIPCRSSGESTGSQVMDGPAGFCESDYGDGLSTPTQIADCEKMNLAPGIAEEGTFVKKALRINSQQVADKLFIEGGGHKIVNHKLIYYFKRAILDFKPGKAKGPELKQVILTDNIK